jgi:uncharacterized protein
MDPTSRSSLISVLIRVGVFAFFQIVALMLFPLLLEPFGALVNAALSVFLAAVIGNALAMRIYEHRTLADVGFDWNPAGQRNLLMGLAGGIGSALLVLLPPLALGMAELQPQAEGGSAEWYTLLFVSVALLFGAAGEELFFRGYGFQVLMREVGPWATILPVAMLFAWSHGANPNVVKIGIVNTFAWGVVLGWAVWRSGDLWLAIGLHFGWNWILPLFGVNLSGFTMGITGYALHWNITDVWSGGAYGPEGGLFTTFVLLPLVVFLWKGPIRRQQLPLLRSREEVQHE